MNDAAESGLNLPKPKLDLLTDFLVRLPDILGRTCTSRNIIQGFVESGMLDTNTGKPSIDALMGTCRRHLQENNN